MNASFIAPTISCGGCARNVTAALKNQPGVTHVDVDVATKRVAVTYDEGATSVEALTETLAAAGYPAEPEHATS